MSDFPAVPFCRTPKTPAKRRTRKHVGKRREARARRLLHRKLLASFAGFHDASSERDPEVELEKGQHMAPLQLVFRGMGHSDAIERHVRRRYEKLATFFNRIVSCHIAVECRDQHHRHGKRYRVRIELTVPGKVLVVSHSASPELHQEDAHAAVDDAFDNAERLLHEYARKLRGDVKQQHAAPRGVVSKLFPDEGYGFLQDGAGAELYFHRNSVLDGHFDDLEIGSEILYTEELGEKGPQASTVRMRH